MLEGIIIGAVVLSVGTLLGFALGAVAGYSAGRVAGRKEYADELDSYGGDDDGNVEVGGAGPKPSPDTMRVRLHQN